MRSSWTVPGRISTGSALIAALTVPSKLLQSFLPQTHRPLMLEE